MDEQNFQNDQNTVEQTNAEQTNAEQTNPEQSRTEQSTVIQNTAEQNVQNTNNYQDHTADIQPQPAAPAPAKENNTLAIVSLVLGIISIVTGCCGSGFLFGIGGIICAVFANKQAKTGMGKAGLITSIVGLVLSVIATVVIVIFYVAAFAYAY